MKFKLGLGMVMALTAVSAMAVQYTVLLSPNPLFVDHNPNEAAYTVSNPTDQNLRVNVNLVEYKIGGKGPFLNDKRIAGNNQFDLSPYLSFDPSILEIPAHSESKVSVKTDLPTTLSPGTYYAAVGFAVQPVKKSLQSASAAGLNFNYTILLNQNSMVYATLGKPDYSGVSVSCENKGRGQVNINVTNTSPFVFSPTYHIYPLGSDQELVHSALTSVLGDSQATRVFKFDANGAQTYYQISWDMGPLNPHSEGMILCH